MNPEEELKKYQEMERRLTLRVKRMRVSHEISKQACGIYEKEKDPARKVLELITANEIAYDLGNAAGELKAIQIKIEEKKENLKNSKLEIKELKKAG